MKYVWLEIVSGKFSNSWHVSEYPYIDEKELTLAANSESVKPGIWKLIKYECLNDPEFNFYNQMKLK